VGGEGVGEVGLGKGLGVDDGEIGRHGLCLCDPDRCCKKGPLGPLVGDGGLWGKDRGKAHRYRAALPGHSHEAGLVLGKGKVKPLAVLGRVVHVAGEDLGDVGAVLVAVDVEGLASFAELELGSQGELARSGRSGDR